MMTTAEPFLSLRDQLLAVATTYAELQGHKSVKRVSTLLFNEGKKLDLLAEGKDLSTGNFERAMQWLSDNWPEGAVWPEGIARPAKNEAAA